MSNRRKSSSKPPRYADPPTVIWSARADGQFHLIIGLNPAHLDVISRGGLVEFGTGEQAGLPGVLVQLGRQSDLREAFEENPEFLGQPQVIRVDWGDFGSGN